MRHAILTAALALTLSGCALLQGTGVAEGAREKVVDGIDLYCNQSQAVRAENRAWINANSPHTITVTCAGDT